MCSSCHTTVTRELVTLAYFSVCLRRSLVTQASSEASACVGDRLTPPTLALVALYSFYPPEQKCIILVQREGTNLILPRNQIWIRSHRSGQPCLAQCVAIRRTYVEILTYPRREKACEFSHSILSYSLLTCVPYSHTLLESTVQYIDH